MKKFILFVNFCIALSIYCSAFAQTIVNSGYCGDNETDCFWQLDDQGHLNITGTGNMKNYNTTNDKAPWGDEITSVNISGITKIGNNAFWMATNLKEVDIPSSVRFIGSDAFCHSGLEKVSLHEGLKGIGSWAFSNNKLTNIILPESLTALEPTVFKNTNIRDIVLPDSLFKKGGNIYDSALTGITTIYCSQQSLQQCTQWLETAVSYVPPQENQPLKDTATLKAYETDGDKYFYNGKWYENPGDIATGHYIKKRIYTVDEANLVTKSTGNSVKIRYR